MQWKNTMLLCKGLWTFRIILEKYLMFKTMLIITYFLIFRFTAEMLCCPMASYLLTIDRLLAIVVEVWIQKLYHKNNVYHVQNGFAMLVIY